MKIKPKNWNDFQHYKNRSPSWIKLHKRLLDDYEFQMLPLASRALAPMLWLLASEYTDAIIDETEDAIAFRMRMSVGDFNKAINPLINSSFFECLQDASTLLAPCLPREEKEKRREEKEKSNVKLQATLTDEVISIFEYWQTTMNHHRAHLDDKRKKIIKSAIKIGYSIDDIKLAITGCSKTPHNIGENDAKQRYDGLHIILKDADNIDRFIRNAGSITKKQTNGVSAMPDNWDDWNA